MFRNPVENHCTGKYVDTLPVPEIDGEFEIITTNEGDDETAYHTVDVEFVPHEHPDNDTISYPRVVFEWNGIDRRLHALIWSDPHSEEPTHQIIF